MKVDLDKIRLGFSPITGEVYAGTVETNNVSLWKNKIDVTNDFIHTVVNKWRNKKETFKHDGYEYEISVKVKKIKKK